MTTTSKKALFEVIEGRYFLGFWFVGAPDFDWLAVVWKDEGSVWQGAYRMHYHAANPDGSDQKNAWTFRAPTGSDADERKIVDAMGMLGEFTARRYRSQLEIVEVRSSSAETVIAKLLEQPWAHVTPTGLGGDA